MALFTMDYNAEQLNPGDRILANEKPAQIMAITPAGNFCYEIRLSDGRKILADVGDYFTKV